MKFKHLLILTATCLYVFLLPGCGLFAHNIDTTDEATVTKHATEFTADQQDQIAQNLIYVLSQADNLSPPTTTLQIVLPKTPFGKAVMRRLDDAGYGLQRVTGDKGQNFVRYRAQSSETEFGYQTLYMVSIGETQAEREYKTAAGKLVPISDVRITNSNTTTIVLNDTIFGDEGLNTSAQVVSSIDSEPAITDVSLTKQIKEPISTENDFKNSVKQNMYETRKSNYENIFAGYADKVQHVLVFPNDSLRLGRTNKSTIDKLLKARACKTCGKSR